MSSHFNYEIEERNMRNQLKALEMPFKEDAWYSYEAYAKQFQSTHKTQLLPNFNFAINRTVVLPIVFGAIIVLFSFLLFNFINIKNSKAEKKEVVETKPAPTTTSTQKKEPTSKKEIAAPIVKKEEASLTESITPTNSLATVAPNPVNTVAKTIPVVTNNTVEVKTIISNTTVVEQNSQLARSATIYTVAPKKKRRKKGNAEVLESIATPVSLPSLTQEEVEPELR
jgi:H+/gluconate symporter-like permease